MKDDDARGLNSLLMSSAWRRLGAALVLIAGLWLGVAWALSA